MTAHTDAFLAELNAACEALGRQISSRQLKALAAVTAARLEAQEARLVDLEAKMDRLTSLSGAAARALTEIEDVAKARYGE